MQSGSRWLLLSGQLTPLFSTFSRLQRKTSPSRAAASDCFRPFSYSPVAFIVSADSLPFPHTPFDPSYCRSFFKFIPSPSDPVFLYIHRLPFPFPIRIGQQQSINHQVRYFWLERNKLVRQPITRRKILGIRWQKSHLKWVKCKSWRRVFVSQSTRQHARLDGQRREEQPKIYRNENKQKSVEQWWHATLNLPFGNDFSPTFC